MIAAVCNKLGSVIAASVWIETSEHKSMGVQEAVSVQGLT